MGTKIWVNIYRIRTGQLTQPTILLLNTILARCGFNLSLKRVMWALEIRIVHLYPGLETHITIIVAANINPPQYIYPSIVNMYYVNCESNQSSFTTH